MSGSVVQRGEVSLLDKWTRAKAAVDAGADLVVELPAYYVLQSADIFAFGGIKLLNDMQIVDAVSFGSESGNIEELMRVGNFIAGTDENYAKYLNESLKKGSGYPAASEYALRKCMDIEDGNFFSPNNILAMNYISAARKINSPMSFVTVERKNDYHSFESDDGYLSATAVRSMMKNKSDYSQYAPDYSGSPLFRLENGESFILGFMRNITPEKLSEVNGVEPGMENLIINSAREATCLEELFEMCVNKRYTLHRIKRVIMCAVLGIKGELECDYLRVLGFNSSGASLLKRVKEESGLKIVTKTADYPGGKMFDTDIRATDFAYLCCDDVKKRRCGADFKNTPYILKNH